jgi:hypothetical protein
MVGSDHNDINISVGSLNNSAKMVYHKSVWRNSNVVYY